MKKEMSSLITLTFADESFTDFYVYNMELTEGISMLYKANISVLTVTPHKRSDLKEILQKPVSIKIEQKFENKVSCVRYLKGIVTCFQDKGVVFAEIGSGDGRKNCSNYILTIEPSFSLANVKMKTRTFKGKTSLEVIKEISKEYDIEFEDVCDSKPVYYDSKDVIFQQYNESDFRFLNRIFLAYGLNYYFYHDDVGFEPKIYITNGKNFKPFSKIQYSSGEEQKDTIACCLFSNGADKNALRLSKWEFLEKLDNGEINSIGYSTGSMFEYNKSMGKGAEIIIEAQIKKNVAAAMKYCNVDWVGDAGYISLTPGTYLEITGISLDPKDKLSCILRETSLYYETVWPIHMALPPTISENKPMMTQKLRALEFNSVTTDEIHSFCFNLSNALTSDGQIPILSKQEVTVDNGNSMLTVATVSDKNGGIVNTGTIEVCDEIDKNNPMMFYAIIDFAEQTPVIVNLVIPFGGTSRGMYYFPKVGERVLLTSSQGKYYLFGYLSNQSEFGDFYTGIRDDMIDSTIFRRGFSDGSSNDDQYHEIKMSDCKKDNVKHLIMYGLIDDYASKNIMKFNMASMRKEYEESKSFNFDGKPMTLKNVCVEIRKKVRKHLTEVKNKTFDYENKCRVYSQAPESEREKANEEMEQAKQDLLSARRTLDKTNVTLAKVAEKVKSVLKVENIEAGASDFSITSDANISIGAKKELKESADKYSLTAASGIQVTSDGEIKINAKKSITLTVGSSTISLNPNGITLRSRKWATAVGPFDSSIVLDSFSGTVIWGMNIIIKSALGVLISDALGASVAVNNGNMIIKGNTASIATNTGITAMANVTTALTQLISQCSSISSTVPKGNADYYKRATDGFMNIWNAGYAMDPIIKKVKPLDWGNAKAELVATGLIPQAINIVVAMIDTTNFSLEASGAPFINKVYENGFSGRDILRLTSTMLKIAATITGMSGLVSKMSLLSANSMALNKDFILSTGEVKITSNGNALFVGPVGGATVNAPRENEVEMTNMSSQSRSPSPTPSRSPSPELPGPPYPSPLPSPAPSRSPSPELPGPPYPSPISTPSPSPAPSPVLPRPTGNSSGESSTGSIIGDDGSITTVF